jgi:hypothetical protein
MTGNHNTMTGWDRQIAPQNLSQCQNPWDPVSVIRYPSANREPHAPVGAQLEMSDSSGTAYRDGPKPDGFACP